jgi:hypothetical protein
MSIEESDPPGVLGTSDPGLGTLVECVQYPIHEARGIGTTILLGQADPFLDRNLVRDVIHVQELDRGQPQNTPIDRCEPLQPPVLKLVINKTVNL